MAWKKEQGDLDSTFYTYESKALKIKIEDNGHNYWFCKFNLEGSGVNEVIKRIDTVQAMNEELSMIEHKLRKASEELIKAKNALLNLKSIRA